MWVPGKTTASERSSAFASHLSELASVADRQSAPREDRHPFPVPSSQFGCVWLCMCVSVSVVGRDSHSIRGREVT